jgi:hypothetical protein
MATLKRIGMVPVDSGQVIVVDPCYLGDWRDGEFDPDEKADVPANDYDAVCRVTCSDEGAGSLMVGEQLNAGVATSSGYGDGSYPAYVLDKDNRNLALVVVFDQTVHTLRALADALLRLATDDDRHGEDEKEEE